MKTFDSELKAQLREYLASGQEFFLFQSPDGVLQLLDPQSVSLTPWPGCVPSVRPWQHSTERGDYLANIQVLTKQLKQRGGKTVISRTICGRLGNTDMVDIAAELFADYPACYCTFFLSHRYGGWLGASPELLFEIDGSGFRTMALAGTRQASNCGPWDVKNLEEHRMVADFVEKCLTEAGSDYHRGEMQELSYGSITHLYTPFEASLPVDLPILKAMMFPTPAVGGLPTKQAFSDIKHYERHPRQLYAGLIELPIADGSKRYCIVNLRCLHFDHNSYCIYAGGGITVDSVPADEWEETERKSQWFTRHLMEGLRV